MKTRYYLESEYTQDTVELDATDAAGAALEAFSTGVLGWCLMIRTDDEMQEDIDEEETE